MTNWDHVANDTAKALLKGTAAADLVTLSVALASMVEEQAIDADNLMLSDGTFFARADALDRAYEAYQSRDKGLCMNRIKTFYSI